MLEERNSAVGDNKKKVSSFRFCRERETETETERDRDREKHKERERGTERESSGRWFYSKMFL